MTEKNFQFNSIKTQTNFGLDFSELDTRTYVRWGATNLAPYALRDVVDNSPTLMSIVTKSLLFTYGEDFLLSADYEVDRDIIKAIIDDLWYYNGFSLFVRFNILGLISGISYLDFRDVRINKEHTHAFKLDVINGLVRNSATKYELFTGKPAIDTTQVFYYKHNKFTNIYPTPTYNSVIRLAAVEALIGDFHYNLLSNNFMVNAIVNFNNGVPDDERMLEIEARLNSKFCGTKNAARVMVAFNDSKENAVTIERLLDDNFDKKFNTLTKSCKEGIFVAMGAFPLLFGSIYESGFSLIEYELAYRLYSKTSIVPKLKIIVEELKKLNINATFTPYLIFQP